VLRIAFRTIVAVLCVGLLGAGAAVASAAYTGGPFPATEFNFSPNNQNADPTASVQLLSVTTAGTDAASGTQTWTYKVSSGAGPAISHWSIGTCDESVNGQYVFSAANVLSVLDGANANPSWEVRGDDPSTGILESRILKIDEGYADYETRTVVITLKGWWPIDEAGTAVVVKAGTQSLEEGVPGPGCRT
jgi:hypothetical protein